MNKRMLAYITGVLLVAEAGLLLLPAVVAVIYAEWVSLRAYLSSAAILAFCGVLLARLKPKSRNIFSREGLVAVALGWLALSVGGALPFMISGEIRPFVDALFETVSGFTTTGASILTDVEVLSRSNLFWRSFTNWVGGMGVLVFVMAALPLASGGGNLHLMRAESPGPDVSKLVPSAKGTALRLYAIYFALTAAQVVALLFAGNSLFESLTIAFSTAGTGGYAITNSSIGAFSTATQAIVTVFMVLFGINFSCYYLILSRRLKDFFKNEELRVCLCILLGAILLITLNIWKIYGSFGEALRQASFQAASVMTTTGFSTADFNAWPELSRVVMLGIMCVGSCVGSTAGGIKVARVVILAKEGLRQLKRLISPSRVETVHFNGKPVSEGMLSSVSGFFILYVMIFVISWLLLSFDSQDTVTNLTGVIATLNNIGPGFGAVGATGNYAAYSAFSKCVLIFNMLAGRLEIFPVLALLAGRTWRK